MKKTVWVQGLFSITLEIGRPNVFTLLYRQQVRSLYKIIGVVDDNETELAIKALIDAQKRIVNRLTYQGEGVPND